MALVLGRAIDSEAKVNASADTLDTLVVGGEGIFVITGSVVGHVGVAANAGAEIAGADNMTLIEGGASNILAEINAHTNSVGAHIIHRGLDTIVANCAIGSRERFTAPAVGARAAEMAIVPGLANNFVLNAEINTAANALSIA